MQGSTAMAKAGLTTNTLILAVVAFLTLLGNGSFIASTLRVYPPTADNLPPLLSLFIVFGGVTVLLFGAVCFRRATKPVLILFLLRAARNEPAEVPLAELLVHDLSAEQPLLLPGPVAPPSVRALPNPDRSPGQ